MRWTVATIVALIAVWGFYVSSPYYALYRLGRAVEAGNVAEVAARVNARALRFSLARQVATDIAAAQPMGGIASAEAQLAASAALALADPILDGVTSPEGLIRLLRTSASGDVTKTVLGGGSVGLADIDEFLGASHWRGFRSVYVSLPAGAPREERFRLQLRLGQMRWRLVALELPPSLRQQIAAELQRRVGRR
ncbi:DUF2939 domain-containing protein [Enterovirga rhinocerotis]|uniref:DUF2939 family protein n=1 Tax=Enterovirga rhinocerotis TaxID=1339210 RepID=A0A4R7C6F0_9HYPH|nr:DUF2939 domain-containing protein [Enterovirga rhinocerotis]TDR93821.1 DUF2939 family protein [Enterovirga rhinocerotis]